MLYLWFLYDCGASCARGSSVLRREVSECCLCICFFLRDEGNIGLLLKFRIVSSGHCR
ncbi:hypothetical protein [Rubritalea tangerina]|uniref:hypothetical protein n=1 Tax=Rubritalea tangerina TaxID=430798 RepID=UPI0036225E79